MNAKLILILALVAVGANASPNRFSKTAAPSNIELTQSAQLPLQYDQAPILDAPRALETATKGASVYQAPIYQAQAPLYQAQAPVYQAPVKGAAASLFRPSYYIKAAPVKPVAAAPAPVHYQTYESAAPAPAYYQTFEAAAPLTTKSAPAPVSSSYQYMIPQTFDSVAPLAQAPLAEASAASVKSAPLSASSGWESAAQHSAAPAVQAPVAERKS